MKNGQKDERWEMGMYIKNMWMIGAIGHFLRRRRELVTSDWYTKEKVKKEKKVAHGLFFLWGQRVNKMELRDEKRNIS